MLWIQSGLCFVLWVGYGIWLSRTRDKLVPKLIFAKPGAGAVCLILGALTLALGLFGVAKAGGLKNGVLLPWAWFIVTLLGVIFVHLQALGAIGLVTHALRRETTTPSQPSFVLEDSE